MKKAFISMWIAVFAMVCYAQDKKYTDGYGDLPWGSSVEQVQNKYPAMKKATTDDLQSGETLYAVEGDDTWRFFRFYKDRLYLVKVVYIITKDNSGLVKTEALMDKLVSIYGKPDGKHPDGSTWFLFEWKLSTDMSVSLTVDTEDKFVRVQYDSPSIYEEMMKAARKSAVNDLDL